MPAWLIFTWAKMGWGWLVTPRSYNASTMRMCLEPPDGQSVLHPHKVSKNLYLSFTIEYKYKWFAYTYGRHHKSMRTTSYYFKNAYKFALYIISKMITCYLQVHHMLFDLFLIMTCFHLQNKNYNLSKQVDELIYCVTPFSWSCAPTMDGPTKLWARAMNSS